MAAVTTALSLDYSKLNPSLSKERQVLSRQKCLVLFPLSCQCKKSRLTFCNIVKAKNPRPFETEVACQGSVAFFVDLNQQNFSQEV